jgi:hypothetical protein
MASITVILTATKGGAVPIGVLVHMQQTSLAYEKGFKMLKEHFPNCFGGLEVMVKIINIEFDNGFKMLFKLFLVIIIIFFNYQV